MHENELMHYGILGMHWGIRNFQKKNGKGTALGNLRRRDDDAIGEAYNRGRSEAQHFRDTPVSDIYDPEGSPRYYKDYEYELDSVLKDINHYSSIFGDENGEPSDIGRSAISSYEDKLDSTLNDINSWDADRKRAVEYNFNNALRDAELLFGNNKKDNSNKNQQSKKESKKDESKKDESKKDESKKDESKKGQTNASPKKEKPNTAWADGSKDIGKGIKQVGDIISKRKAEKRKAKKEKEFFEKAAQLSDEELAARVRRLSLENSYRDALNKRNTNTGRASASELLTALGGAFLVGKGVYRIIKDG